MECQLSYTDMGERCLEIYGAEKSVLFEVKEILANFFGAKFESQRNEKDSYTLPFSLENNSYVLSWQPWFGITLTSLNDEGDYLLENELAPYIIDTYDKLEE